MQSRLKLLGFMLVPAILIVGIVILLYKPQLYRDAGDTRKLSPAELTEQINAMLVKDPAADFFVSTDGVIYLRHNLERLKSFTVTKEVMDNIKVTHQEGAPWAPGMASKLPIGTKLYHITDQPDQLAVRTIEGDVFYMEYTPNHEGG